MACFGVASQRGREAGRTGPPLWNSVAQRLADGGEVLVEVGRHVGQVLALGRLGGEAEADPDRIDLLQGLIDGGLIDLDGLPALCRSLPC